MAAVETGTPQAMKFCLLFRLTIAPVIAVLLSTISTANADEPSDFSRWEKSILAFEAQDRKDPPPKNAVLFVGSSSIRLWNLAEDFPALPTINRGFGGSEIADSTHFADRIILKHRPRTIVLYAGDNDIARGKSAAGVESDFRSFVKTVRTKLPDTRILFLAIKPSIKRWNLSKTMMAANDKVRLICEADDGLAYVDIWKPMLGQDGKARPELFAKDGLHLNRSGYKLWTKVLSAELKSKKD